MRIRIEDDFDSELENEYKSIDNDSNVGNGKLSNSSGTIIDVDPTDVKATDVEVDQATNDNPFKAYQFILASEILLPFLSPNFDITVIFPTILFSFFLAFV